MTTGISVYYPQGPRNCTLIDKQPRVLKSGTEIKNFVVREGMKDTPIGSQKRMTLGDTLLRKLGVDRIHICKAKGQKEALIRFLAPQDKNGITKSIGFLQKSENNQMKMFVKILKDYAKHGVKPDFGVIADLLKYIK